MAGARRPNQQRRPNRAPAPRQGFGNDYRMGKGGQLSVSNSTGGRSWLGKAETDEGSLVPLGQGGNGYMQYGRVPIGNYTNAIEGSKGTPFAKEGMDRAGYADEFGWNPVGKQNTQAFKGMLGTGAYGTYGQGTGAFEGYQKNGKTPFAGLAANSIGTGGHMELGQKGQDTGHGMRRNTRGQNSQGGMPGKGVPGKGGGGGKKGGGKGGPLPNMPPKGGGMAGGVGEFPKMPSPPANFLPMTPGYEQDWRGLNDQLSAAEGQFAQGQAMLPAEYNLMNTRMQNDQNLATKRLNEDLAGRGVFTAKNAAGTYGGTSPSGGGVGQSMYSRDVATPFGRQFQDLAAQQAGAYNSLYGDYAGANLGYAQGINEALLNRANEAYQLDPMGLANSGYEVPDMASPYYPFAPQNRPNSGKRRPRKNSGKKNSRKRGGRK